MKTNPGPSSMVISPKRTWQVLLVLLLFTVVTVVLYRNAVGEDLASSYMGCRLVAAGQGSHLYSHSSEVFSNVGDPLWKRLGWHTNFRPLGLLHPYVQTPLWAYSLAPLCTHMNFRGFFNVFLVLAAVCMAGTIYLVSRYWAPSTFHPLTIALVCGLLLLSEPFRYAMYLLQTHVLFIFLSVLALLLAEGKRPVAAGILLALAAAVKVTPGLLLIYWLMTRQRRAAFSFIAASVVLLAVTLMSTGTALFGAYLHELAETSKVLLVSFNVQSFAAWATGWHFGAWEQTDWKIHPLPTVLKLASTVLTLGAAVAGGWLDRDPEGPGPAYPPYGAAFALLGVTMFTPIAWNHYYILMVLPVLLFLGSRKLSSPEKIVLVALLVGLNLYPVRYAIEHHWLGPVAVVRTQWYSGLMALGALWVLARRVRSLKPEAAKPAQAFA